MLIHSLHPYFNPLLSKDRSLFFLIISFIIVLIVEVNGLSADCLTTGKHDVCSWINVGFGEVKNTSMTQPAFGLTASYENKLHLFSARFMLMFALSADKREECAFLYGRRLRTRIGFAGLSLGPDYIRMYDDGFSSSAIGLAAELQWFLTPVNFAGVGIYGFAGLNQKESYVGFLICLQFGRNQ